MRRRISIDPDGAGLYDHTDRPYLFDEDGPNSEYEGALYDEDLWRAYLDAEEAFRAATRAVCNALVDEPYDDVERELGAKARALLDTDDFVDAMEDLGREAIANALFALPLGWKS